MDYLKKFGKTTWACDCHIPYPIKKELTIRLLETSCGYGSGFVWGSLYYNWCHLDGWLDLHNRKEPLSIHSGGVRGSLSDAPAISKALRKFEDNRFICYNGKSIDQWFLLAMMEKLFPDPAPWEKDKGESLIKAADVKKSLVSWEKRHEELLVEKQFIDEASIFVAA